jgi:hypothetical protein
MSKRCSSKKRNGGRCGAWAVTGASKCALHLDPERAATMGSKHALAYLSTSLLRAIEIADLESRLAALEAQTDHGDGTVSNAASSNWNEGDWQRDRATPLSSKKMPS